MTFHEADNLLCRLRSLAPSKLFLSLDCPDRGGQWCPVLYWEYEEYCGKLNLFYERYGLKEILDHIFNSVQRYKKKRNHHEHQEKD